MERETGIEPATNSLEGCDSTTELLPREALIGILTQPGGRVQIDAADRAFLDP